MKKLLALMAVLTLTFGLVGIFSISSAVPVEAVTVVNSASNVCPGGDGFIDSDGWIKFDVEDYEYQTVNLVTYTADEGYIIEAVCVKGGNEQSPNNYLHTFYVDGWIQVDVNGTSTNCVGASGIGTNSARAERNSEISGSVCAEISHGSFKVRPVTTEPTPDPTPDPTEPTPDPTEPTPDPTEPTPDPTEPTPEPKEPTPEPKEPTPEPKEPTPEPKEPTPDPTKKPVSVETDPELGASNLPLIVGGGIALLGTGSFFLLKKKK